MEDLTKEYHACASAKSTQAPAHHRIYHTRLWKIVHGEAVDGLPCEERRGAEEEHHIDSSNMLDEILIELQEYCRKERNLAERLRTLRFTRSGFITAVHNRAYIGAGEKCGYTF